MKVKNLLLEQDGTKASVESAEALVLQHLAEATDETIGIGRLRDETDTGGLKGAQGNVGEELGGSGRGQVDSSAVVGSGLVADGVDGLLLEELVTTELERALEEVTGEGRAGTGEQSAGTLVLDDLAEATNHTTVVGSRVELDTGLDAVSMKERVSDVGEIGAQLIGATSPERTHARPPNQGERQAIKERKVAPRGPKTYTSTGVRAPWVTEQQTAPARAKREYRARPWGPWAALTFWTTASTLVEPVDCEEAIAKDGIIS
jgi:hypothetical protein